MKSAVEVLQNIYADHQAELPPVYKWVDERARLNEFFYCLILGASGKEEVEIQNIVTSLASLNLLDVNLLADAKIAGGPGGKGDSLAEMITNVFLQNAFEDETARACTLAICEAAKAIRANGKLQILMRKFGNEMLEDLSKALPFSKLSDSDKRFVLIHWLQNAFELPIPVSNEYVDRFAQQSGISVDSIVKAADELDVNVAAVDDLLKLHMLQEKTPKRTKTVVA